MTPPTPSKASLLLRCFYTQTLTHTMFLAPCVSIERVRDSPPHRHALSFSPGCCCCSPAGGALCTCALVPLSLSPSLCVSALYLQFPFVQFRRVERSFLFLFYFFLNHLTRLPGGCNITTTTNSRDTGQQQQRRRLRLRRRRQQPMMVICFAAF